MGAHLRPGKRSAERPALAPVVCPEHARRQPEKFSEPIATRLLEGRPKQYQHPDERQASGTVTFQGGPVPLGPAFPQQCPNWRGSKIQRDMRNRSESQRPIKAHNVRGKAQSARLQLLSSRYCSLPKGKPQRSDSEPDANWMFCQPRDELQYSMGYLQGPSIPFDPE